ncbi:hypothetical protein DVH24_030840 [Malus domestica]|uniref:DRBM domain-containing protein n=1 Tax=Malus domestica TaxID=3750 RepID=A0A498HGQ7_MALDO|nr:hypothetical protein DVH24_030840 [Malus domestica]
MQFVGKPKKNKQLAERDAAIEALAWLTHTSDNNRDKKYNSTPDGTDKMLNSSGKVEDQNGSLVEWGVVDGRSRLDCILAAGGTIHESVKFCKRLMDLSRPICLNI